MTEINGEIWKEIPNFDDYMISNLGRVKSFKQNEERIMTNYLNAGYYAVLLTNNNGKKLNKNIHRLLAELFISNPDNLKCVDHIDTQKLNNNLSNLRWCTFSQNSCNKNKQKRKTSSIYKEVSFYKPSQKWLAYIKFEGKKLPINIVFLLCSKKGI